MPREYVNKIIHSENFIAKQFQIGEFIVINRNHYCPVKAGKSVFEIVET